MEVEEFFEFGSKYLSTTIQVYAVGLKTEVDGLCDHDNLIKGEYLDIIFPITFKQECGKNWLDILDTGWPSLFLISKKMKVLLETYQLTGWKTFPIKLYDKKESEIADYYGFSIKGQCGPKNYKKSEIIEKRMVPRGPICSFYKGVSVDNWDGSDFFIPAGALCIFITKKAANILKKNKITNMRLENLAEYEIAVRYVKIEDVKDSP